MSTKHVFELSGVELDYWVARAVGAVDATIEDWGGFTAVCVTTYQAFEPVPFRPSTDWSDGGPIIDRYFNGLPWKTGDKYDTGENVWCGHFSGGVIRGRSLLECAMRLFVASKFGDTVTTKATE